MPAVIMLMGSASVSQAGLGQPVKKVENLTYSSTSDIYCAKKRYYDLNFSSREIVTYLSFNKNPRVKDILFLIIIFSLKTLIVLICHILPWEN